MNTQTLQHWLTMPVRLARLLTPIRLARIGYYLRAGQPGIVLQRAAKLLHRTAAPPSRLQLYSPTDQAGPIGFPVYERPQVSVLIPVFDHWETTRSCLISVRDNTPGITYEVIIADDGSSDSTARVATLAPGVRHINNEENLGFLRNCNQAARQAQGKYLVLLNNDTLVQPGWLPPLIALLEENGNIGLAGPMLLYPDGRLQEAGGIVWQDGSGWNYGKGEDPLRPEYNYLKEVDYISGACIVIRKALWDKIGGFDERFSPAYYEDTDLAFRIRENGYKVVYQPLSRVVHLEGVSHGTNPGRGVKVHQARNRTTFQGKWNDLLATTQGRDVRDIFRARDRSMHRKRVLFIDHHVPMRDRDAGSRSTFQYLELMADSGYQVTFLGADFTDHQPYTQELQQLGIEVLCGAGMDREWKSWVARHGRDLDYVYISRPDVAKSFLPHIRRHCRAKRLYCGHDLYCLREERRYQLEGRAAYLHAARHWARVEEDILRQVDVAYFFSQVEVAEITRRFAGVDARITPLYLFAETELDCREAGRYSEREGLLFVGGFMHPPNADAVRWFTDEVFPLVIRELPGVELTVVGADPPADIRQLDSAGIRITGRVSDEELQKCYQRARLVVAPLRFGAGVKGKIVEAMRHGVPTVTTSIGAEGIGESGDCLLVADTAADFAKRILCAYSDQHEWTRLRLRACETVAACFSRARALEILQRDMPT